MLKGTPRKDVLIRNYREQHLNQGHWTHLVHPIFGEADGLAKLHSVLMVTIDAMQTPDTHGHADDMDEVWYMLEGERHPCGEPERLPASFRAMQSLWHRQIRGIPSSTTQRNRSRRSTLPVTLR